jgi:hypothetical protein
LVVCRTPLEHQPLWRQREWRHTFLCAAFVAAMPMPQTKFFLMPNWKHFKQSVERHIIANVQDECKYNGYEIDIHEITHIWLVKCKQLTCKCYLYSHTVTAVTSTPCKTA